MGQHDKDVASALAALGGGGESATPENLRVAQSLIEVLPIPVFFKSRDGRYLGVNKAWEEFFGLERSTILGQTVRELYSHAPAIAERHVAMDEALWARPGVQSYELPLLTRGGDQRHALYYKATFVSGSGAVAGLIGTIVDVTARKRSEQREAVESAVARLLGSDDDLHDAIRGIIRVMCERLDWACGARWSLDERENRLHCIEDWSVADPRIRHFLDVNRAATFVPGKAGLIRKVLATGVPVWVEDVSEKADFQRASLARAAGLHGAFALPVVMGERVLGAIEFYSRDARKADPWLLQIAQSVGRQIGQLMVRREAETALRESEARFRSLTELSSDWFWEQDEELRFTAVSRGIYEAIGLDPETLLGKRRWETNPVEVSPQAWAAHRALLEARERFQDFEYGRRDASGEIRYMSTSGHPVFDEQGRFRGYRGIGRDVTERRRAEAQLRAAHDELELQANYDALTGLPNRHLLNDRLRQAVFAQRNVRSVAVVFIDLDHFKVINDSLGHNFGDEVLRHVGERLQSTVRDGDTVARIGGDEFVIILNDQTREDMIFRTMRRLVGRVGEPIMIGERELNITCSAGISLYPQDGPDVPTLLKNADAAMYRAKSRGRNTFQFFTAEMNELANERLSMEQSLRRALERGELTLHYQPRVSLRTGEVVAVEALVRWNHPERGLILPDRFIPLAEETGLIVPIGEWVLRVACSQGAQWRKAGFKPLAISVNLSARQLWAGGIQRMVAEALGEYGMAGLLELELTETMVMHDPETVIATLQGLKATGVRLSVDDFGTGYSSLSYLRRLPIHALKIDASFVRDIHATGGPDDGILVRAIISLAHSLHLDVIAEGVETQSQWDFLRAAECDEMQGYLYSAAVPPAECERFLATVIPAKAGTQT